MLIWLAKYRPAIAMAEQERAAGRPGGASGGGAGVRQDAAAVSMQARPDPGGRIAAGYDVQEDLDRMIADKNDDACRARIDAWVRDEVRERMERMRKERMERMRKERMERMRKERVDYAIKNRTAELVRAFIGPPVSLSRPGGAP